MDIDIKDFRSLPPEFLSVLRKYRIISKNKVKKTVRGKTTEKIEDGYTLVNLKKARSAENQTLGEGPIIALDALQRIVAAAMEANKAGSFTGEGMAERWLDWMLFNMGGGKEAKNRSKQAVEQVKERFVDERVRGHRDSKGVMHAPITQEEAVARWEASKDRFSEVLFVGDQDMVDKLQVFGYYRNWPGQGRIYANGTEAVTRFLRLVRKTKLVNKFFEQQNQNDKVISFLPESYASIDSLNQASARVERFFASRRARQDVRVEMIYDDDYITALCPLTYAAAVKYGWDAWQWANRGTFEERLEGKGNEWNDPWTREMKTSVFVYLMFKVPMPSWVAYDDNEFRRHTLQNLAVVIPREDLKAINPDTVKLYDEENKSTLTFEQIEQNIRDEAVREYNPEEEEFPIHRGPRVYQNNEEAEEVVAHLNACLEAIATWAARFNPNKVVVKYLGGDAAADE